MIDRLGRWAAVASLAFLLGCSSSSPTPEPGSSGALTATAPSSKASATAALTATATATASSASGAETARSADSFIDGVSWAPSGDRLAVWCGAACKYADDAPMPYNIADLPAGTVRTALVPTEGGSTRGAHFSDKGTFLVASAGNTIQVLKTADLSVAFKLEKTAVYGVMGLNPEETHFAWADAYGYAEVVDLATGKAPGTASLHDPNAGNNPGLEWLPGGRVVFSCNEGCTPELWGTKGKRISRLHIDNGGWGDLRVVVTPAGSVLVADSNGQVGLFDGKDGKGSVLRKKEKPKNPNEPDITRVSVALSGDGKKLVVGRTTGELTVFDLDTKKAVQVLAAREGALSIEWVFASHDGSRIALGDFNSSLETRPVEKATPEKLPGAPQGYSADGVLVVRGKDFVAGLVDGKEKWRRPLANPSIGDPRPGVVVFSKDRKVVAIPDGQLQLVRASDGKTATLALESKGNKALVPHGGTTAADVAAVLGK